METLPALAVERLSIPDAYRIGRTVRYVGYILDQEQQRIKIGEHARALTIQHAASIANVGSVHVRIEGRAHGCDDGGPCLFVHPGEDSSQGP